MREILFRGKLIDNDSEEWIEGIPIKTHIGTFMCFDENPHYCSQYGCMEIDQIIMVDESTISQYTGLRDKYGKKIFENSIVREDFGDCTGAIKFGEHEKGYGYYIDWVSKGAEFYREDLSYWVKEVHLTIVGNIFDNPELLEGASL